MTKSDVTGGEPPSTLHQRIRGDIEARILSGAWAPGHRIPFEHELMVEYGCSRMTVNKAISALADVGLVVRRRRAGSFVARPRIQSVVLDIPDIQGEIQRRGEPYGFRLLSRRRRLANPRRPEEVELAEDGEVLVLRGLHLASDRPFSLEERLIGLSAVPEAAGVDFDETSPGAWLLSHVPWTEAEHRIYAVNADADAAGLLAIEPRAACLAVERRTWRGGERITFVRNLFPGDAYDLIARFGPARA
ncbi:histidine utilization repressor [Caulobacter sp. CCUG 60055]|uniref:histidine utilization repressor n=1 Tax=Caulobacter sp. CCUG 60055 TaxID=2100090 RepID=UPI001FA80E69|nr:histidine utilization repressor [Caulobacter sp. CCUG 60055]MCI3180302.1 histidine utilization repressor [Caulobacter sp. CCUG 60055]